MPGKCGRQHPKTARPGQIFRQGDGNLSVLFQSKTVKNKQSKIRTAVVLVPVQPYYTYRYHCTCIMIYSEMHLHRLSRFTSDIVLLVYSCTTSYLSLNWILPSGEGIYR